jgi:hypothetical protein
MTKLGDLTMKQTKTTKPTTGFVSQRYLNRNYYKDQEWVKEITKYIPFKEDESGKLGISCCLDMVESDGKLYVSKKSVKSEIRRLLSEGDKQYPNSVIVCVDNRKIH